MALEKRVFSTKDFQAWGKENAVLFAAVMTKIEGREDDGLLQTYGFRGFPSMAILDSAGEVITKKVNRDLGSMRTVVAASTSYNKLKAKVDAGEPYDKSAWLFAQLGLGQLDLEAAKTAVADLKLTGAAARQADQQILVLEIDKLRTGRRGGNHSETIYGYFKAGRHLPEDSPLLSFYDSMLVQAAQKHFDAEAFHFSYKRARAGIEENIKAWQARLPRYEADLQRYAGNERYVTQIERAIQTAKAQVKRSKRQLADLDAFAAKLKDK